MADAGLQERDPGAGFRKSLAAAGLRGVLGKELLAIAYQDGSRQPLEVALGPLPDPGHSTALDNGGYLLWTGVGQLLSYRAGGATGEAALTRKLAGAGYVTDVSDGWIALEFEGPDAQDRLDLITLPDLSEGSFALGRVTSTVMSHIRVLIWRRAETDFVLLSPASSARSLIEKLSHDLGLQDRLAEITT